MPNIAVVLKEEIARLARKELRGHTEGIKKASAQYRRDIAELKRQVTRLERRVAVLEGPVLKRVPAPPADATPESARFSAKGLRSQRQRLGLSAADYAKLAGVTSQSIYNWEQGKSRPRKEQVATLAALRGMGKKEALARVQQLDEGKPRTRKKA